MDGFLEPFDLMLSPFCQLGSLAHIYTGVPTRSEQMPGRRCARQVLSVRALDGSRLLSESLIDAVPLSAETEKYVAHAGDVIVPARSTSFGAAILPDDLDGIVINATLIGIRCGEGLHPRLLAAYLRHPMGRAAIDELSQSGTAQMNITVRVLANLRLPVPPRDTQERIARMLEAADAAYDAAVHAADLRHSIANEIVLQAMTGATI